MGRGVSPYELGYRGVDHNETKALFLETLQTVCAALTSDSLTAGTPATRRYDDVPIQLHPMRRPYPPLWYATTFPESAAWAGEHGLNLMGLGEAAAFRPTVDAYRAAAVAAAGRADRLNGHVASPRVGMNRQIVVAPTDEEAWNVAAAAYPRFARSFTELWYRHGDHRVDGRVDLATNHRQETMLIGSPASVAGMIRRQCEIADVDYFSLAFAWGDLSPEQSRRSLELFAEHVMPSV